MLGYIVIIALSENKTGKLDRMSGGGSEAAVPAGVGSEGCALTRVAREGFLE